MADPKVSYFFKKFYGNIIKWWFVVYNPIARRIWPTKEEEEEALRQEEMEEEETGYEEDAYQDDAFTPEESYEESFEESFEESYEAPPAAEEKVIIDDLNYNQTTGAFSGLYGQGPMDDNTQAMLDQIMGQRNTQIDIDSILGNGSDTPAPAPEVDQSVLDQANEILARLQAEAEADEAAKQAEIDAALAAQH